MEAEEDDDDWTVLPSAAQAVVNNNMSVVALEEEEETKIDHRTLPRKVRKVHHHAEALGCVMRDYLGPHPLFDGKEFDTMFRVSKSRFQRIMEDAGNSGNEFFLAERDAHGKKAASMEARLLLPLKTLAHGVPPHCFRDYFQMSKTMARDACMCFDIVMKESYKEEHLRCPDAIDLKAIHALHKHQHKTNGVFGSLDCMHAAWKNCPKAWQGNFKGKEDGPTIVLEGMCDYHLWFWHLAHGHAGTSNDKLVWRFSPFLEALLNGSFKEVEEAAKAVPYKIMQQEFISLFMLVDGVYNRLSRFVRGVEEPVSDRERNFTGWQEGARKDIERAFGALQCKFQFVARPIVLHDMKMIATRFGTCIILHNMCASDGIMDGDAHARCDPSHSLDEDIAVVTQPDDLAATQNKQPGEQRSVIGMRNMSDAHVKLMTRKREWDALRNHEEHCRSQEAPMDLREVMSNNRSKNR